MLKADENWNVIKTDNCVMRRGGCFSHCSKKDKLGRTGGMSTEKVTDRMMR